MIGTPQCANNVSKGLSRATATPAQDIKTTRNDVLAPTFTNVQQPIFSQNLKTKRQKIVYI
jgi:hypothetical protein